MPYNLDASGINNLTNSSMNNLIHYVEIKNKLELLCGDIFLFLMILFLIIVLCFRKALYRVTKRGSNKMKKLLSKKYINV